MLVLDNLFMDFDLNGNYDDARFFGLLQSITDPGSQKYDALLSGIFSAGDANLDGTVDYADFQILEANYGLSNTWWEQGDFNDDGMVNWSDLNLLRTNLDPAEVTLGQFAQMALFGLPSLQTVGQSSRIRWLRRDLRQRNALGLIFQWTGAGRAR